MDEDILQMAAAMYMRLMAVEYHIVLGRKGKKFHLNIEFTPENFFHLAGLHKLKERYSSFLCTSEEILVATMAGELTADIFHEDLFYETVKRRMCALQLLEKMLDSDRVEFFGFNNRNSVIHTKITADYLAKEENGAGVILFSFLAEDGGKYHVKSVFTKETYDYTMRQTRYTVLLKEKTITTESRKETVELYRHNAFGKE